MFSFTKIASVFHNILPFLISFGKYELVMADVSTISLNHKRHPVKIHHVKNTSKQDLLISLRTAPWKLDPKKFPDFFLKTIKLMKHFSLTYL